MRYFTAKSRHSHAVFALWVYQPTFLSPTFSVWFILINAHHAVELDLNNDLQQMGSYKQ